MSRRTKKPSNVTPITVRQGVVRSTGEVLDVEFPATRARRRRGRRKVFALVDLEVLANLELSAAEFTVLAQIMRRVNPESNYANVGLDELARDCDMLRPSVSRVMKDLRGRRIVATARRGEHLVNPHIMFRGSNQDWDIATETYPEPVWRRA